MVLGCWGRARLRTSGSFAIVEFVAMSKGEHPAIAPTSRTRAASAWRAAWWAAAAANTVPAASNTAAAAAGMAAAMAAAVERALRERAYGVWSRRGARFLKRANTMPTRNAGRVSESGYGFDAPMRRQDRATRLKSRRIAETGSWRVISVISQKLESRKTRRC